jgi:hypothetical protein
VDGEVLGDATADVMPGQRERLRDARRLVEPHDPPRQPRHVRLLAGQCAR